MNHTLHYAGDPESVSPPGAIEPPHPGGRGEPPANGTGFTLIETLVALALAGLAMLLVLSLLWQQPRILERLEAQRLAYRAVEATLETLRAGDLPLAPGTFEGPAVASGEPIWLTIDVQPTETPDLLAVTVRARYAVRGKTWQRSLDTLFWRPGHSSAP